MADTLDNGWTRLDNGMELIPGQTRDELIRALVPFVGEGVELLEIVKLIDDHGIAQFRRGERDVLNGDYAARQAATFRH